MESTAIIFSNLSAAPNCDNSFGPADYDCNGRFDFTLLFEQSILAIVPSAVLFLAFPLRATQLAKQAPKVLQHPLSVLKLV